MYTTIVLIFTLILSLVNADVSHLAVARHNNFRGYNYDPPTSTPFIPEIIVNKGPPSNVYLPPSSTGYPDHHPPQDEFDTNVYLPPFNEEIPSPPQPTEPTEYLPPPPPPPTAPDNEYLPPQDEIPITGYQYPKPKQRKTVKNLISTKNHRNNALQIVINSLRCLEGRGGFYQANIIVQSFIENLPIIDLDTNDPQCQLQLNGIRFILNIRSEDFQRCGITHCGRHELCINLRFPQIFGMKSLDDGLLTLKCRIQERVAAKTHTLRVGVSNVIQGRNSVVFAQDESSQQLRTQLGLYRHSGSGFSKNIGSGAAVQLGEELMLRAQIKSGDGWNHSRMSDVILKRIGSNGEILNTAQLIKSNGCINPSMQSICSIQPVFEPPLGYRFGFRAVMFQGMKSGDEMQMSVRIVGCIDSRDCQMDQNCADDQPIIQANRVKRSSLNGTINHVEKLHEQFVEVSNISFRVLLPIDEQISSPRNPKQLHLNGKIAVYITIFTVALSIFIIFMLIKTKINRTHTIFDKY